MNSDQGGEPLQEEAEPGLKARGEAEPGPRALEEVGAAESGSMVSQGLTFNFFNGTTSFPSDPQSLHREMNNEHLKKASVESVSRDT